MIRSAEGYDYIERDIVGIHCRLRLIGVEAEAITQKLRGSEVGQIVLQLLRDEKTYLDMASKAFIANFKDQRSPARFPHLRLLDGHELGQMYLHFANLQKAVRLDIQAKFETSN